MRRFAVTAGFFWFGVCQARSAAPPSSFTAGFWFWDGSSAQAKTRLPQLETLFLQVGSLNENGIYSNLPRALPAARQYWLVYRRTTPGLPSVAAIPELAARVDMDSRWAKQRGLVLAGIQLDIDSPTGRLGDYAGFLRHFRKALRPELRLSITALLDWFTAGSAVE